MNPAAKFSSALLIAAVVPLACGGDQPGAPTRIAAAPVEDADVVAKGGAPKITADEAVYEFGAIKATDSVEHVFEIRNVGDADLKIERVQKT
jgi:hypothetical protein